MVSSVICSLSTYFKTWVLPKRNPIWIKVGLQELAKAWARVKVPCPSSFQQAVVTWSLNLYFPEQLNFSSMLTWPSSKAARLSNILKIEPGLYLLKARLVRVLRLSKAMISFIWYGLNVGLLTMARISLVWMSITTAAPFSTLWSIAFSTTSWIRLSMVRTTVPFDLGWFRSLGTRPWIGWPRASTTETNSCEEVLLCKIAL